jgi:hypothetical protein
MAKLKFKIGVSLEIKIIGQLHCFDKGSIIVVRFTDGTNIRLVNGVNFNCDANKVAVSFAGLPLDRKNLEELKTNKIQSIGVWHYNGYIEKDFTAKNQEEFFNVINCLFK